jgi:four helix bundle protein
MTKENSRKYDLEERTYKFAKSVIGLTNLVKKSIPNTEVIKQLVRSSGSVGANYIEANEALSKKDFAMRIKICRKESKDSVYWLKLIDISEDGIDKERQVLINEATELMKIFGAIVEKTK